MNLFWWDDKPSVMEDVFGLPSARLGSDTEARGILNQIEDLLLVGT